jgi:hypothetical protein
MGLIERRGGSLPGVTAVALLASSSDASCAGDFSTRALTESFVTVSSPGLAGHSRAAAPPRRREGDSLPERQGGRFRQRLLCGVRLPT